MNSTEIPKNPPAASGNPGAERYRYKIAGLQSLSDNSLDSCFLFALLMTVYFFIQWPILAFDTDLWTHLNGGRYLVEHGSIPGTSFYSFVSPQRDMISYSWLFKGFVYLVFRISGYHGLIVVRTLVFAATLTVIFSSLRNRRSDIGAAVLFVLYFLLFVDSAEGIRPYSFSFLFIALFLYVLENHPQKAYLLPILAIVWINFHGIEYPVMMLIVGCYLAAYFRDRLQRKRQKLPPNYRYLIPLALCFVAVFITPFGIDLLRVPFTDTGYASSYISELRKLAIGDLFHFRLTGLVPDFQTVSNLLLFAILAVAVRQVWRRQAALHHLVLLAGGCFLLTRGIRFVHEFAILSLPLVAAVHRHIPADNERRVPQTISVSVTVLLLVVSFLYMHSLYGKRPKYPVTNAGLPAGVANFLQHVGAKGRVLNDPVTGGYLSWRLWPDCLIHMDMQVPFLFSDSDFFEGSNAIYDKEASRNFLRRYEPDYLSLPIPSPLNKDPLLHREGYLPVFFDDREILYVRRARHRDIAEKYQLKMIHPAKDGRMDYQRMTPVERQDFQTEATRLIRIYPESLTVNRLLALYYSNQKEFPRAVEHADRIIRFFPNHPEGYLRKAAVLKQSQSFSEALTYYRRALNLAEKQQRPAIYLAMAESHFALQQYRQAYKSLVKSGNVFSPAMSSLDLYRLALTAYQAKRYGDARVLAQFAALKQPTGKGDRDPRIDDLIRAMEKIPQ